MTLVLLVVAVLAMFVAAVVAGFETGIYALSHVRLRYRLSVDDAHARTVEKLLARQQPLLTGILLAQNAAIYFTTALVAAFFERAGLRWGQAWGMFVLAIVLFIFVDAVPKNVFRRTADVLVYPLAKPFLYLVVLMRPAGYLLTGITRLVSRFGAGKGDVPDALFTRERLAFYLREGLSEGILSDYQVQLAHNILRAEKITVSRAMVAIDKASMIPYDASAESFHAFAREKRFARYPVYRGATDNVVGILNIYDCYLMQPCPFDIDALMRPPVRFAPDVRVIEAIKTLREARQPLGIVIDHDRALGVVTLKDCLEEIVGELYAW